MESYLQHHSLRRVALGQYVGYIVENPLRALDEEQQATIVEDATAILQTTTGRIDRASEGIRKSLFGREDGGRVLVLFKTGEEKPFGFTSFHLMNRDGEVLRHKGSSILHIGSGHILPTGQGNNLLLRSVKQYVEQLPVDLVPSYLAGFTQSPRLLKLATHLCNGNVYPNLRSSPIVDELGALQKQILPDIVSSSGNHATVNGSVLRGSDEQVYSERLYTGTDEFDHFFYTQLGVNPQAGDFLHFVAVLPDWVTAR